MKTGGEYGTMASAAKLRKALLIYEGRVLRYVWQLEQKLSMLSGKPTNATRLLRFFSFDVIGDLTLGTKFQMLESDVEHFAADVLRRGMLPLGVLTPVPWLLLILSRVPGLLSGWDNMISWSDQQVERRIKEQPSDPDIFTWWLDASLKNNSVEKDRIWLDGDSLLAILAGSDTVSATLILSLYYLARYPAQVDKLREELRSFDSSVNESKLQALPHLNAFINETLRLHPPVPSGLLRETPPEGLTIAGQYIPGSTTVVAPFYTISRLESCFESAEDFIPERWTSKPQMVKDKTAFAPFSLGLYSCIGKNLALMEVRAVITCIISKFDIDFAPGESSSAVLEDMHDTFTAAPGPLNLVFRIRE
ncbi:hypothetical protein MMC20_006951 [Loxospora ochrophaea]|nr:hypothetical protein [Loxospora ochrophaea]